MISYYEMLSFVGDQQESYATKVVRSGMNLRKQGETSIWEDFINLCGNTKGLAELLDVKESQVRTWAAKIREEIKNVQALDQSNPELGINTKVVQTGNEAN